MKIHASQDIIYTLGHVDPVEFLEFTSLTVGPENVQWAYMKKTPDLWVFSVEKKDDVRQMVTLIRETGEAVFG